MKEKEQMLVVTEGSIAIGILYNIINFIEYVIEEEDLSLNSFSVSWSLKDRLREDPGYLLRKGVIEIYSSNISYEKEKIFKINNNEIIIRITPGFGESSFESLYDEAINVVRLDRSLIRDRASRTTSSGIEYMFLYLADGRLAVFEGERFRVRLPFVEAALSIHTHPEGSCGLSAADIQSGLDLLVSGGLMSGAATVSCIAFMLRKGFVHEDDYIVIKEYLYYKKIYELQNKKFKSVMIGATYY